MKQRWKVWLRIAAALLIGAGCAAYAPFAPFAISLAAAVKFALWGGIGFLCTFGLRGKISKRLLCYALPISFFLALSFTLGAGLQTSGTLDVSLSDNLPFLGIWALCFLAACHLFVNAPIWLKPKQARNPLNNTALLWSVFFGFAILACGWLLAFYPIMTNYDIHAHLAQIASGQYETHHSLLYTLLIRGLLSLASVLGLGNACAFLMLGLLQMAAMGLSIAYGLVTVNRGGADRRAVLTAAVYYCVFPLFGYFAFSTTKDTLFGCFLLLTAVELYRLSRGRAEIRPETAGQSSEGKSWISRRSAEIWGMARLTLFAALMCLMRYNGMLTLLLFLVAAALYGHLLLLRRRPVGQTLKKLLVLLPVILVLSTGAGTLLNRSVSATTPDTVRRDMLSLPLQQMARVLLTATDETDIARIEGLFGVSDIRERYRPDIADPVKAAFLYPAENTGNALRAWLKLGVKYPGAYLEAFLQLTRGAWFIDDLSHTKIDYWLSYTGYLETVQKYSEADFPIAYQTPVPALRTFLEQTFMDNRYLDVPLVRYVFALAVQAWIAVIALCYAAYHKRRHAITLSLFALCALLPVFLLPCVISRYFLPLFLLNPLCLLALTARKENADR